MNEYQGIEFEIGDYEVVIDVNGIDGNDVDFSVISINLNPDMPITQWTDGPSEDDIKDEVSAWADAEGLL